MSALPAPLPSSWALVLYSGDVIQKTAWKALDHNVGRHLNGSAASHGATDDILLPTFEGATEQMMEGTHMTDATLHDGSIIEIEVHGAGPSKCASMVPIRLWANR